MRVPELVGEGSVLLNSDQVVVCSRGCDASFLSTLAVYEYGPEYTRQLTRLKRPRGAKLLEGQQLATCRCPCHGTVSDVKRLLRHLGESGTPPEEPPSPRWPR